MRGEFFLFGQFGNDESVGLLSAFVEVVALPAVFDDVEAVVVEVLNAVEDLAQLQTVHLYVDAVYYHVHLHHVPHVRCEPLRTNCAQTNSRQILDGIGWVWLELLGTWFFGTGGGVVGEGMCHHPDEVMADLVLIGVIGDEHVFCVVEVKLQFVDS